MICPTSAKKGVSLLLMLNFSLEKVIFWMLYPFIQLCLPLHRVEKDDREVLKGRWGAPPSIFESILWRTLTNKCEETDDKLLEELEMHC